MATIYEPTTEMTALGAPRCQYIKDDSITQCGAQALKINGGVYCKDHDEALVRSKNKKQTRYGKHMPSNLLPIYEKSQVDPDILTLRHEISLCDTRTSELIESLAGDEAPKWSDVQKLVNKARKAATRKDPGAILAALESIEELAEDGGGSDRIWEKILQTIRTRAVLVEGERKRMDSMNATVTAAEMVTLAGQFVSMAAKYITDRSNLGDFVKDIKRVSNGYYLTDGTEVDMDTVEVLSEDVMHEQYREKLRRNRESVLEQDS